jgi:ABC-type dipeptide/oligopeptide/nickel transport system permease subunit
MQVLGAPLAFIGKRAAQALLVMLAIVVIAFAVKGALGDLLREIMGCSAPMCARHIALALVRASLGGETLGRLAVPLLVLVIGLAEWPDFARTARAATPLKRPKTMSVPRALSAQATRPSSVGISCPISSRR